MSALLDRLRGARIVLADGAWGSNFIAQGLDTARECADLWNLHHPGRVSRLAAAYARSADILTTNTFGASRARLAMAGLETQCEAINTRGVALAREGAALGNPGGPPPLIAGSIGPARDPRNTSVTEATLFTSYREQAALLAEAGADFILVESMTSARDAAIAVEAARAACALEVVCSFAFRAVDGRTYETWCGDSVDAALDTAINAGADVVGANCAPATPSLLNLVETMRGCIGSGPIWLKPNAGQPEQRDGALRYPHPFEATIIEALLDALGHGVFGGCCGAGPAAIALIRDLLNQRNSG